MKRNSKLLSLIIAFAMILTMVAIPVSAASSVKTNLDYVAPYNVNLFEEWLCNWNYDLGSTRPAVTGLYGCTNSAVAPTFDGAKGSPTVDNVDGRSVRGRQVEGSSSSNYMRVNFIPVEYNEVYVITADVKLVSDSAISDKVTWMLENGKGSGSILGQQDVTVNSSDWTTVKCVFRGTKETVSESDSYRRDVHVGFYTNSGNTYIVDNWTLTKVADMQSASYVASTGVNLYDEWCFNWNYDTAGSSMTTLYGCTNAAVKPVFSTYTTNSGTAPTTATATGNGGSGMKVTNATSTGYYRTNFIPVEDGAKYLATADVMLTSNTSDTIKWALIGTKMAISGITESNVAVNNTGWTTVQCVFSASNLSSGIGTDLRRDISIGLYPTGGSEYIIDNWTLTKLPAAPSVTNAEEVDGKAVFTFDNEVVATDDNFTVSPATADIVVTGSGTSYTVELSNYTHSTEYTITTTGITDTYGQALTADASVKLVTPVNENATILNTENLAHNAGALRGTFTNGTFTRDTTIDDYETYGSASFGVRAFNIYVVPGTYVVSAKVKQNAADEITAPEAFIVAGKSGASTGIDVSTYFSKPVIGKDSWSEITGIFTVSANADYGTAAAQVIHAGISSDALIFDVADLEIRKAASLDINDAYSAVVKTNDSDASLYITGPASTVYFAAATYTNGAVTGVQFKKLTLTENKLSVEKLTKGDSYKFFIWDSNLSPLNCTFTSADIN